MFKITILRKFDPMSAMPDSVFELPVEYKNSSQAELRALLWLTYRPRDIVMLVPA